MPNPDKKEKETLKIDTAFPEYDSQKLKEILKKDWKIFDKSIVENRYIFYVLVKET